MEKLETKLEISAICRSPNIATLLSPKDLETIGAYCRAGYKADRESRRDWEKRYALAYELALQVVKNKSFPWPGASNVKFPLLTIAALNFHSRAYPAIVPVEGVVKAKVLAPEDDPEGARYAAAERVGSHMSYQLQNESNWEEETDRELLALPILGCVFRRVYFDIPCKISRSDLVFPNELVVGYYAKSFETAEFVSLMLEVAKNTVIERERQGLWVAQDYGTPITEEIDQIKAAQDRASGYKPPATPAVSTPYTFIEQMCLLDLDGDGYAEPYFVIFEEKSGRVARIWARFTTADVQYNTKRQVSFIKAMNPFTKITFLPSPDGSFYDMGLGQLLAPINASVDSLINMLIDSGVMYTVGGGFLGRGVKIRGGRASFLPGEWKRLESSGEDLQKGVYPLPVKEPATILFELLTYLVGYGERIAGATDVQVGTMPEANAKTGALQIANENGRATFTAIFKRVWRCHSKEFEAIYNLNSLYFDVMQKSYLGKAGKWLKIQRQDYDFAQSGLIPTADPNAVSKTERIQRAQFIATNAINVPGHNVYKSYKRLYDELGVQGVEEILPDPKGENRIEPGPDVKLIEAQAKTLQAETARLGVLLKAQEAMRKLDAEEHLIRAKVIQLLADAELKMSQSETENRQAIIDGIQTEIEVQKHELAKIEAVRQTVKELMDGTEPSGEPEVRGGTSTGERVSTMETAPGDSTTIRLPSVGTPSPQERVG